MKWDKDEQFSFYVLFTQVCFIHLVRKDRESHKINFLSDLSSTTRAPWNSYWTDKNREADKTKKKKIKIKILHETKTYTEKET